MSFSTPKFPMFATNSPNTLRFSSNFPQLSFSYPRFSTRNAKFGCRYGLLRCYAAAKQQKSGGAPPTTTTKKKRKPPSKSSSKKLVGDDFEIEKSGDGVELLESPSESAQSPYSALPLPNPPAGFVLDEQGRVLMASNKRIATIVDSTNNFPLECVIRRVFRNSRGDECMLLCPVDTPVQILKSVNVEGWSAVSDEEVEAILPTAAYALAKIHMHLVHSGFCYTARGGFCYTEEDIFEFHIGIKSKEHKNILVLLIDGLVLTVSEESTTNPSHGLHSEIDQQLDVVKIDQDNGEDVDGLPTEGVEIACFHLDGSHYMIYTPSDPLLFVAVKDKNGVLQIADDELLDDPAIISAIDEETEFNALVEEEAALLDSLLGKR